LTTELPTIELRGLDRETAATVLEHHAGGPLAPGTAERIFGATLGNPLALVELAATNPAELTLPETTVEHAFAARIAGLPDASRRLLALAAAEDLGELAVLDRAAAQLGLELGALAPAEHAGLVNVDIDQLSFCHPLARSAAYRSTPPDERRAAHRALASADPDPDRQAWHAAAAAFGPDAEAAQALDEAGGRARTRGAYAAAAGSFERAARLTPARTERPRRLYAAAEAAWLAGHTERAQRRLEEARELSTDPVLQCEIDHLRGHAALRAGRVMVAHDILVAAAERAAPDQAVVMLAEAAESCLYASEPEAMLRAARRAWDAQTAASSERARFFAALALGTALTFTGQGDEGAGRLREANELLERSDALKDDPRLLSAAALAPLWLREAVRGRALVERAIASARDTGAVGALPVALWLAARDAATSDRFAIAVALYEEGIRLSRETGQATALCAGLAGLACVEARQGHEDACREHAQEALHVTEECGIGFFALWALNAMADLELGLGHVEAAVDWLQRKERLLAQRGIADPDLSPAPELIEALLRLDRALEATPRLVAFEAAATAKGQPWSLARLARARGLLGEPACFDEALRLHADTPDRFEEARTLLCQGETLRRARQRTESREPLRRAIEAFDALGAAPWAERARAELGATGETARRRDPVTLDQLTPRELQVALVLADGHTIRETAAKLFLSPKTVDYHLRHVYRKLAIDSRAALAQSLRQDRDPLLMRTETPVLSVRPVH
jgi:DNA-binding CsgD family transcriptional regulator